MFSLFQPKLPLSPEQRQWIDRSFVRLGSILGAERLLNAQVVLPIQGHFPDRYDRSEESLDLLFRRVAHSMEVPPEEVEVGLFLEEHDMARELVPFYSGKSNGAGGLYYHASTGKARIAVNEANLKDPMALVAILAHELCHVILLRPGLVGRDESDMEPLTDLLTVFLGLGVFTANAAFQFKQYTNNDSQGWSTSRLGYLSEEQLGYALARFALERGEVKPAWGSHLPTNVSAYFHRSQRWLQQHNELRFLT